MASLANTLYDGNAYAASQKNIPRLHAGDRALLLTPAATLATPVAGVLDRERGQALYYGLSRVGTVHDTGFRYVECRVTDSQQIAVLSPCFRTERYRHNRFEEKHAERWSMKRGDRREIGVFYTPVKAETISAFMRALHPIRSFMDGGAAKKRVLPMSKAVELVAANLNSHHWHANTYYCNATGPDGVVGDVRAGYPRDWMLTTGWCSGTMTAYGLMRTEDEVSRQRAVKMIDFICEGGISPSGLFYFLFDGERWCETEEPEYRHIRPAADAVFFLIKAIESERERGLEHPEWEAAVLTNLNAMLGLWLNNRDFGHYVDRQTSEIIASGSAGGALCIACLAKGSAMFGSSDFARAAEEAGRHYYAVHVATGHLNGGPLDIEQAPDSESACAILESFVTLYELTGNRLYLAYAEENADYLASWTMSYDGAFPVDTPLDMLGIQTSGGIIANAQNHHVGPSTATSSMSALLRLYRYGGNLVYLNLLRSITTALQQYVCRFDGHIGSLKAGMITEQINLTDALNDAGEIWDVSASWPQTNILLARAELPSVYVDFARRVTAVLDHVHVETDYEMRTLRVANETKYEAVVRIEAEGMESWTVRLAPDERTCMRFR